MALTKYPRHVAAKYRAGPMSYSWLDDLPDDLLFRFFVEPLGTRALFTCKKLAAMLISNPHISSAIRKCNGKARTATSIIKRPVRAVDTVILRSVLSDVPGYINDHALRFGALGAYNPTNPQYLEESVTRAIVENDMAPHLHQLTISDHADALDRLTMHADAFANVRVLNLRNSFTSNTRARVETWTSIVSNFPNLVELDLTQCTLHTDVLAGLFDRMNEMPHVEVLSLSQHVVFVNHTVPAMDARMAAALDRNPLALGKLHTLKIDGSRLTGNMHHFIMISPVVRACLSRRPIKHLVVKHLSVPSQAYAEYLFRQPVMPDGVLKSVTAIDAGEWKPILTMMFCRRFLFSRE